MATYLNELVKIWGRGNRRPRGTVAERLQWLFYEAWRREQAVLRMQKLKVNPEGLAEGATGCRVSTRWSAQEDTQLRVAFERGDSLEQMALAHERTTGAIIARLCKHRYMFKGHVPGNYGNVYLRNVSQFRPEYQGRESLWARNKKGKWVQYGKG